MFQKITICLFCFYVSIQSIYAQELHIKKAHCNVKVDAILDEQCWGEAQHAKDFQQVFPFDTSAAQTHTEAMVSFDDNFFYVAAICYDSLPGDYVVQSLKRDFSYPISDAFTIILEPFSDKTNGFAFGVNPVGAQREGLISNGGNFGVTTDWDNVWYSSVKRYSYGWVVEMAIPLKTLRYKANLNTWGLNFGRNDLKRNESSTWTRVPRIFNIASLAFTGTLVWDEQPPNPGTNISLIPYAIAGSSLDSASQPKPNYTKNIGLDAKIAITPSLNLDLTVNPNFSQVEVDRQQINLTRFNIAYPEKRVFFLENSDLFSQFGFRQIRPFFSRQIGLYQSPIDLQLKNIPIIAGARLSGKINKLWRTGIMDVQTASDKALQINGQNYFVAAFQRQLAFVKGRPRSHNLEFIIVNRQKTGHVNDAEASYNRVMGMDLNILSPDNKWVGKVFVHQSFAPGYKTNMANQANASFLAYQTNTFYTTWNHEYVGKHYLAQVGFVPRPELYNAATGKVNRMSYGRLEPEVGYRFYPKGKIKKHVNYFKAELYNDTYFDSTLHRITDFQLNPNLEVKFQNSATFILECVSQFTRFLYPTNITGIQLPVGDYYYRYINTRFETNKRKKYNIGIGATYGGFYTGQRFSKYFDISYRLQPYGVISLNVSQDLIKYPSKTANIIYISPKAEMAFAKNFFFTTFVQYNAQTKNTNLNCRLQWRFRPMSDLFVVYSDNYDQYLNMKNRAIVVKFIYWLNV
ncbi:MAG: DUF5916 domain-containing protein [Bacteroidota bacterium]|nr:DUF5916 domain-containing protein [Bacteroidota bacterium]